VDLGPCEDAAESASSGAGLRERLDQPLRLPKVPLAVRLAARSSEPGPPCEASPPRGSMSARVPSRRSPDHGANSSWSSSLWLSPRGVPLRSEDLERTIQKVDFGRLEARLREADGNAVARPSAPPLARRNEGTPKQGIRLGRQSSLGSCDTEEGSVPLVGLLELEAMESVFSAEADSTIQETTCDDEAQLLFNTSGGVCGSGCRFTKFAGGLHRLRGPDDEVVGGLHAFLSRADDEVLRYILHPARGQPPDEPAYGVVTAL